MKSLSAKTFQCGVTVQGLTTLSGTVYLTALTNTATWDYVVVGTTAQGQIYTRTYAQFMSDVATGIGLSSGTTNYLSKFTGSNTLGNSLVYDNGTNVGIGTSSPSSPGGFTKIVHISGGYASLVLTSTNVSKTWEIGINSSSLLTFYDGSADRMVINASGNVGIGITNPSYKLDVAGSFNFVTSGVYLTYNSGVLYHGDYYQFPSGSYYYLYGRTGMGLIFGSNNTEVGRFDLSGNLGIGTTSPSYKLQVNADGAGLYVLGANSAPYTQTIASFVYGGNGNSINIENQGGKASLQARAGASVMDLHLNPVGGNVGIGTTSPTAKLHTVGTGIVNVVESSNTVSYTQYYNSSTGTNTTYDGLTVGINGLDAYVFHREAGNLILGTSDTERIRITAAGNVGIGTNSPVSPLDVFGIISSRGIFIAQNSGTYNLIYNASNSIAMYLGGSADPSNYYDNTYHYFRSASGSSNYGVWNSTGLGIGTSSPTRKLYVVSSDWDNTSGGGVVFENSNTVGASLTLKPSASVVTNGSNGWAVYAGGPGAAILDGNLGFWAHGTNEARMVIQRGGNVGVGTTNPSTKLDVNGVITATGGNSTQWNTAYSWGNHASIGYLTSITRAQVHTAIYSTGGDANSYTAFGIYRNYAVNGPVAGHNTILNVMQTDGNYGFQIASETNSAADGLYYRSKDATIGTWRQIASREWVNTQAFVPQARTLTINGTSYDLSANRSWTIATTTPGGSNTQFQYNSSGTLAGASALTYNSGTNRIGINQSSPGYDLDVNGQVRVQDKLRVGNVNSGNGVVHMSSTATINPSATTIVWSQNVSVGMCAFIEYYILNNNTTTDQRAGTIIVTWNQSGTPTIAHTETTTPDIGSTTPVTFTSSLVGSDARINAVNSSAAPYTIVMNYRYF